MFIKSARATFQVPELTLVPITSHLGTLLKGLVRAGQVTQTGGQDVDVVAQSDVCKKAQELLHGPTRQLHH